MNLYDFTTIDTRIRKELNLETTNLITPVIMMQFVNRAIDDCEAIIHDLHMDYFLTSSQPSVTAGDTSIAFPTDCFGTRIRWIQFDDGSDSYKVGKIKFRDIPDVCTTDEYRYLINNKTTGLVLNIYPNIRTTSSDDFTIWYIRNAKRITATSDTIDIGEQIEYIISHVKLQCLGIYPNPILMTMEIENMKKQEAKLISVMSTLADDGEDSIIEPDYSTYEDHS